MRKDAMPPLRLFLGCVVFALWVSPATPFSAPQASPDVDVVRALLRDIAVPQREKYREDPRKIIAVVAESLRQCSPQVVRSCVLPDVFAAARTEAAKGTWSFDLVSELENRTKESFDFGHLDVSGFDRIIVGPRAELDRTNPTALPMVMSRPAIRAKSALVIVQFARVWEWLVLLSEKDTGWVVTTKIAYGAG